MNYEIEEFRLKLFELINNSGIPIGAAVYIFKDCYRELLKTYDEVLKIEKEEIEKGKHIQEKQIELNNDELNDLSNEEGKICSTNFNV